MKLLNVFLCAGVLLLTGCSVTVVPRPTSPDAVVNPADRSITETRKDLKVSARVQDLSVAPYQEVGNLTSFYVELVNHSDQPITVPLDSFVLIDGQNNQYNPIQPAAIQKMTARNSTYLIPYPYVGYYYLEDSELAGSLNAFDSSLPFYDQNHPQDLLLDALPVTPLLPGARLAGMVYFNVDLTRTDSVQLRLYLPGTSTSQPADFVFPFSIEK